MQAATLRKLGYFALATALATLLITGTLSFREWRRYEMVSAQREEARRILTLNEDLIDVVRDAETGQRGFLLTGRPEYLDPYNAAVQRVPTVMNQLATLIAVGSDQSQRLQQLRSLADEKMAELRETIELYRSKGSAAAQALVQTDQGKRTMDRIRAVSQQLGNDENARWLAAWNDLRSEAGNIRLLMLFGTVLLVGLVFGGGLAMRTATMQVEKSSELLRATLYSIGDGVIATNAAGTVQMINSVAEQLTGYTETEARGLGIEQVFRIVNESTRGTVENPVRRVLRDGKVVGLANHTVLISKTGRETPIDDSGAPVARPGETARGVVLVFRDVSERKRALETASRLAAIIENSDDAIVGKTLEGIVTSWNRGAERLFGYTAEEMIGSSIKRLVQPDRADDMQAILERVGRGESVENYHTERLTKDGRRIAIALTVSPIRNDLGEVVGASKIAHDITHERELEQSMRQMQKMEAMGRLAGGVAHDFNNLLTVILGYSAALKNRLRPDDPLTKMATEIERAAGQAAAVTGQLLTFSRKQVTQPRVIDLNDAVVEMKDMLQRLIGEDIDLAFVPEQLPCPVKIDPGQVSQVLMNLAAKARDAMPRGGMLTIETHKVMRQQEDLGRQGIRPAGLYSQLVVTDTGMGMSAETQAHIFEPFFTTKDSGKGTGLGLATVYGILQQQGGWIDVYSGQNHGTTFRAYFRAADSAVEQPKTLDETADSGGPRRPARILLVEDQAAIRMLAEDVLRDAGHEVLSASNGRVALELGQQHKGEIDLLITDVVMPELSGPELAAQLCLSRPNLLVLYISGFTSHALLHQGAIEEGTAFLQKPFVADQLLVEVDSLWQRGVSAGV